MKKSFLKPLLACLVISSLAACTLQHQVRFDPNYNVPITNAQPIPLRIGLVMPETSAMPPVVVPTRCIIGQTIVTLPYDQEYIRLAYEMVKSRFKEVDLVADKASALGQYDALIEFSPPTLDASSVCVLQFIAFWEIFPIFVPPDEWRYTVSVPAKFLDSSGQHALAEASFTQEGWSRSTGLQEAFTTAINNVLLSLTNGPKFIQYAQALRSPTRPQRAPVVANLPASAVSSEIDALPPASISQPHTHAIVIGIENYRQALPHADFAAADARLAAKYYERVLGVPEENVAVLINDQAAKSDFEKYFERWLPNRVEEGDTIYIYYSGHGAPNPKTGEAYLVPFDADPTYIEQTGYSIAKLYRDLGKLPAKKVVVAMDSCFSGAGGRSVIARGARPLVTMAANNVPQNLTVITAAAGDQISSSYQDKGHGLFTYFFLKGLKEKGSDLQAVYDYLRPEVSKVARREYNADQTPQWQEGR